MVLLALVMVLVMLPSFAYAAADSAATLTREEFYEALCIEYGDVLTDASANDLKDAGVTSATAWAIGNKIVTANSGLESNQEDPADKYGRPEAVVTRATFALVMNRLYRKLNAFPSAIVPVIPSTDISNYSESQQSAIENMLAYGLMHQTAEGKFDPAKSMDKTEALEIVSPTPADIPAAPAPTNPPETDAEIVTGASGGYDNAEAEAIAEAVAAELNPYAEHYGFRFEMYRTVTAEYIGYRIRMSGSPFMDISFSYNPDTAPDWHYRYLKFTRGEPYQYKGDDYASGVEDMKQAVYDLIMYPA